MWRRDTRLTAYQPQPGAMKKAPAVLARYFIGSKSGRTTWADLRGTGEARDVLVTARARLTAYDSAGKRLWECVPTGYVLDKIEWVEDLDALPPPNSFASLREVFGFRPSAFGPLRT
jgi:hypothetical protein